MSETAVRELWECVEHHRICLNQDGFYRDIIIGLDLYRVTGTYRLRITSCTHGHAVIRLKGKPRRLVDNVDDRTLDEMDVEYAAKMIGAKTVGKRDWIDDDGWKPEGRKNLDAWLGYPVFSYVITPKKCLFYYGEEEFDGVNLKAVRKLRTRMRKDVHPDIEQLDEVLQFIKQRRQDG